LALELALENQFLVIIVEGDAKTCIDAIIAGPSGIPWTISAIVTYIKLLALKFSACTFEWIGKDANFVAHSIAKFVVSLSNSFSCNSNNLPPSICEAWLREMCFLSS
jgi:hypothetical protein